MKSELCLYFLLITIIKHRTVAQLPFTIKDVNSNDVTKYTSDGNFDKHIIVEEKSYKPLFEDCQNYKPTVDEQQPIGTPVIQVTATDKDPPNKKGGRVSYKIVKMDKERDMFTINNITGNIYTNLEFDRDEPSRQKELYLTVQATDDGRPPLADICTFKVTITDINDNDPSFDQAEYITETSEDLKEGAEVIRVFAYDLDEGENARLTYNFVNDNSSNFNDYFRINSGTGVVYLKRPLIGKQGTKFSSKITATDNGAQPNSVTVDISITVVSSDKKSPHFKDYKREIDIDENCNDFETPLVNLTAESNIEDESIVFELVKGKTVQTNKDQTFILAPRNDSSAFITLARPLDYETVTEYQLTVRIQNKDRLGASVNIIVHVKDVNDEIPTFIEFLRGSVVENDVEGAQAMQVRAVDKDGTSPNNLVHYELLDNTEFFKIDKVTGVITAVKTFDREKESLYHVSVRAYDLAPSALVRNNSSNFNVQKFQISIEDRNDNKPTFVQKQYVVNDIPEGADRLKDVIEVQAHDKDVASSIIYSIIDGNDGYAFLIENSTGRIKVNATLDYEKIERYNLTVHADDGLFTDDAEVIIYIQNENDEPPVFLPYNKTIPFPEEEESVNNCIITLKAYDPDIKDRNADQHIHYEVANEYRQFLHVMNNGCVKVIKKLDRDKPFGAPQYQAYIHAYDNDNEGPKILSNLTEINIVLIDINDNAPFLNITEVVWYENENPGKIVTLTADDYDSLENGPPFTFEITFNNSDIIKNSFSIIGDELHTKSIFDREERKYYDINITIRDSGNPQLTGFSNLRVIIGDKNDNEAQDGSSEIYVYKYEDLNQNITIGRIYVNDPDDWDLPDKIFQPDGELNSNFLLSPNDAGMIIMRDTTRSGVYHLKFIVTEEHLPLIPRHSVKANVTIYVKEIPQEAVRKSGSIRFNGSTIENFIEKPSELTPSKRDIFQKYIANIFNISQNNVDVFTVLPSRSNESFVDIRFSAHGSPYYAPERLNNKATEYQDEIENQLDINFVMIGISECLMESVCPMNNSCSNNLVIKDEPIVIFTNKTSFVGVQAVVEAVCECRVREIECLNGGTLVNGICHCPDGSEGPHCEMLGVGFNGDGWALYPTLDSCNISEISLSVLPQNDDGLIFYAGPMTMKHAYLSKDFISLELRGGYVVLKVDLGYGQTEVVFGYKKINDGALHKVVITLKSDDVIVAIDECSSSCISWQAIKQPGLLNVNGPLQIGGLVYPFSEEEAKMIWQEHPPTSKRFYGCVRNFTFNSYTYNLGFPSDERNIYRNCNNYITPAAYFSIDSNFLVAILVCIAILFILLLAVVVHRRKHDNLNEKDVDDTRENIINYEDEGGGECDTNFDLSVFQQSYDEKPPIRDNLYKHNADIPADISGFLDNKKHNCDKDPDNLPYDDVRYYAYEGDGNSTGSLSSLASCTDEGDLKFNYLSCFGPRFRKLADMYGEDGSDEDSQDGGEESWC